MKLNKVLFTAIVLLLASSGEAQTARTFYNYCQAPKLGQTVAFPHAAMKQDFDEMDVTEKSYKLECKDLLTLYGRKIHKIQIKVDSANAVMRTEIYLPFDTSLHKEMQHELGAADFGWMAFKDGADTSSVIRTRFWSLPEHRVGFRCTRYSFMFEINRLDYIIVSILPNFT